MQFCCGCCCGHSSDENNKYSVNKLVAEEINPRLPAELTDVNPLDRKRKKKLNSAVDYNFGSDCHYIEGLGEVEVGENLKAEIAKEQRRQEKLRQERDLLEKHHQNPPRALDSLNNKSGKNMSVTELANLVNRLERVAVRLEKFADITTGSKEEMSSEPLARFVVAYDAALAGPIHLFLQLSNQIGGELKTQVDMVQKALNAQRNILITASKSQTPNMDTLPEILKPISDSIQAIQSFREKNRASKLINHLSAISEAIPALGWVAVSSTPAPYVKDMIEAGQFYTNRVLVEYKEKDKTHCDWARSWISLLSELQTYVKQNHTTGLTWNPKGSTSPVTAGPGGPPPPPPPPPMEIYASSNTEAEDARAALFREINKGEGVTQGLKRVDPNQQTHKNPNLRTQSAVPYKPPPTTPKPFQSVKSAPARPPKFELEGKKWLVEYHNGNKNLEVSNVEMNQSVHVYQCIDCLLVVKGKLNSIVLDNCKKTAVVFDDIVACVEFINCQSMQAQSMGKVPTINIDKTDGVQIYLSKDSLNCEVVTAKASEINISIPQPNGDFVEHPVPEQFKTTVSGKKLITIPVEQA